jgi:superfamily II DNA or RNA helicase
VWKKKKLADGSALACDADGKGVEAEKVNHLDAYKEKEEVATVEEVLDVLGPRRTRQEVKEVKKNYVLNEGESKSLPPLCFAVKFFNLNRSAKKNLQGDGIIIVSFDSCTIYNMQGQDIGSVDLVREPKTTDSDNYEECDDHVQKVLLAKAKRGREMYIYPENHVIVGNMKAELRFRVPFDEYRTGAFFLRSFDESKEQSEDTAAKMKDVKFVCMAAMRRQHVGWVTPWKTNAPMAARNTRRTESLWPTNTADAVVLYRPKDPTKKEVAVVVDPVLGTKLRPHQVVGLQFLYDCTMGLRGFKGNGCILADDMGLGKTIQAIGLVWTLMNQGPKGLPAVKKTIIVCPSSLVGNWCNEFNKWLGEGAIDAIPLGDPDKKKAKSALAAFEYAHETRTSVLVASYDQLKIYIEQICKFKGIDLVICDEGHRLKNAESKTSMAVNALPAKKRIILSGTPIQNDLEEFHAMVSFVNPGILKDIPVFRTVYIEKILAMREPEAEGEVKAIGRERSLNLSKLTSEFILRRTATVNRQYLPPKVDHLVIIKLSPLQESLYKHICGIFNSPDRGGQTALGLISDLKKVCNDPYLVRETYPDFFKGVYSKFDTKFGSKLRFVEMLLEDLRASGKDRIVIVSNYTQTLAVMAAMCQRRKWGYFQLDGSTVVAKRQKLVDLFNDPKRDEFVFLLSSKAGGCGLNLVGANHLVLFDPDWNPANDLQAMARVWRPGQNKKVYLYRTLATGTIEEKIFQRQVAKLSLADSVVAGDADAMPDFSLKDLRDIFTYRGEESISDTHDLLACRCAKNFKKIPLHKRQAAKVDELVNWEHHEYVDSITHHKLLLRQKDLISFTFAKETDPKQEIAAGKPAQEVAQVNLTFDSNENSDIDLSLAKRSKPTSDEDDPTHQDEDDDDDAYHGEYEGLAASAAALRDVYEELDQENDDADYKMDVDGDE